MTIEKEISLINKIIAESIIHGGDDGGSYGSNRNWVVEAINEWLKEKIHKYGQTKTPKEILINATGEAFDSKYYIDYLKRKWSES